MESQMTRMPQSLTKVVPIIEDAFVLGREVARVS